MFYLLGNSNDENIHMYNIDLNIYFLERLKKIYVPQFLGLSFLEIPVGEIGSNSLSIRVWFLTSKPDGVIMYASQFPNGIGDYISLNIVAGAVEFRFNMGAATVIIR